MSISGFESFCLLNKLKDCADRYGHQEPAEKCLLIENQALTWAVAKERIFGVDTPKDYTLPFGWKYNYQGIIEKNAVKWETLETEWIDYPKIPGKYFVELVTTNSVLRHSWLRLIDNQSRAISVGFLGRVRRWLPMRSSKGRLVSPDPYEISKKNRVTRIEISADEHRKLKEKIEEDQANENLLFNLVTRNCAIYACEVLSVIGININPKEFATQSLARRFGYSKLPIPPCIKKIIYYVGMFFRRLLSPFYNGIMFLLGATYVDPQLADLEKEKGGKWPQRPKPLRNFFSFFDISHFHFGTGWKVANWQKGVEKLRESLPEDQKFSKAALLNL